jgi:hypothetical protein
MDKGMRTRLEALGYLSQLRRAAKAFLACMR